MNLTKNKVLLFAVILYTIIFLLNCADKGQKMVARVGGRKITVQEFENAYAEGKLTKQIQTASFEEKLKFLNRMIDKKLKIIDAYQHGLDKEKIIQNRLNERRKGILFRSLVDKEVVAKIIPESMVKEYYKNASKEVKIRQIVLKFDKKTSNKLAIQKKAKRLATRLKKGDNFADIARKYSEDESTAKDGGKKGFLRWGPSISKNPMYKTAFSMKEGEVSDPIEMADGYYIIKVTNIKKFPMPPFEKQKEKIKQSIFRIFSKDLEKAYYGYLDKLKKKYKMKFSEPALDLFLKKYTLKDSSQQVSSDSLKKGAISLNPLDRFSETDNQKIFVEFSFSSFKINYFLKQLKKYPPGRLPKFTTKEQLKSFLNQRIVPVLLLEHEVEKRHLQNDEEVKKQIKDFQESLMETNIYRLQVMDKISITDEKIKKYFNEHRDDFKNAPMRDVQEIYVASKTTAKLIVSAAKKGNNFTTLFDKYNEKKALSKKRGKLGFISKGRARIGKPAFKIKVGEITDPIKIGKGYSIIKVLSEKPETLKTFDESKRIVSARLRRTLNKDREKEWLNRLRKKVSVAIYEKNLDQACKNVYGADVRAEK